MNLKTAEAWRLSEAAIDFAENYVQDPVFKRQIIFAVWQTRGYNIIAGAPVPIGENVHQTMGRPNSEWQDEYMEKYRKAVQDLFDAEAADEPEA